MSQSALYHAIHMHIAAVRRFTPRSGERDGTERVMWLDLRRWAGDLEVFRLVILDMIYKRLDMRLPCFRLRQLALEHH
jgi:hypothetical protein